MRKVLNFINNRFLYKVIYILVSISFVTILGEVKLINSITSKIMILWSIYIILRDIILYKFKNYTRYHMFLILFLIVFLLSIVFNTGKVENIKIFLVAIIEFFALFSLEERASIKESINNIINLSKIMVFLSFIGGIISVMMLFFNTKITIGSNSYGISGKLFSGIYNNENTLGIMAFISIILSIVVLANGFNRDKYIYFLNICLQIFILYKARANSAVLAMLIFIVVLIILNIKNSFIKATAILMLFTSSVFTWYKLYNTGKLSLYLNGRYAIWKTAIKVIKENMYFGVGNANVADSVIKASKAPLMGVEGGGMHNIFIQISVANGLISSIIFILFLLFIILFIHKYIMNNYGSSNINVIILSFSLLISLIAINMFEANLIYIVSFISFTFWSMLSFILQITESPYRHI
ncbi:O-antigen ligase family protein [Desnuesiella massiliensis]|uniref:O-antigen ligase family protein n=1 Tax=Desnuesiella massiliensis TaxID=1650662 RepID=UPI0006E17DF7|nr:O-antigen ligase family protein [Desnuesiella massiliensis]